jgi:hypothetical protein
MMRKIEQFYMAVWCLVMPVTGTLLIPAVQGTVPAYMMGFGSVLFVLFRIRGGEISPAILQYAKTLGSLILLWLLLAIGSQLTLMLSQRHDFAGVNMLDPNDSKILLRTSLFTQSLYLLPCLLIALYFRYFFRESWMRYVFWGGYFLAGYGIYEWVYFLIFKESGDFLVDRSFGSSQHTASWSQGIPIGGIVLLRIKSTLGEPTFFAAAVLPFLFLALDYRKLVLIGMLLFTALFSTSTACYITLGCCLAIKSVWTGRIKPVSLLLLFGVAAFLTGLAILFPDTFSLIFEDKLSGNNDSGKMRLEGVSAAYALLDTFSLPNWLFGIGFGYTYLNVFLGLLVNTGLIGLGAFLWTLFKPLTLLPIKTEHEGLKLGLIALAILSSLSLSELFLPTTWMFLGLAHRKLAQYNARRRESAPRFHGLPSPAHPVKAGT